MLGLSVGLRVTPTVGLPELLGIDDGGPDGIIEGRLEVEGGSVGILVTSATGVASPSIE